MKKRLLAVLLVFTIAFAGLELLAPVNTAAVKAAEAVLPKKGDVIRGFQVTEVTYDSVGKTDQIQLTHQKSGAKMLVLKNDSKNRGFAIGFNTPAEDDKGINHILEHAIIGGSEKYPSKNLIFDLSNATYTSYVNAFTYQNMTMYPVCSESEAQLLKLADVYMSSVYQPLFVKDKKVFEREAWRYTLEEAGSPIGVTGVVYNEMRGNYGNIQTAAYYNGQKSIFPDTNQSNVSGGRPEAVLTLSYEEFVKTYQANYHPANSFMVLYGDVDYEAFLKLLDEEYLSSYQKKTFKTDRELQKKFRKLAQKNYSFPASENADTKNKSVIELIIAAPDIKKLGIENYVGLSMTAALLSADTSSFKQALTESGIAKSYNISVGVDTYQPTIRFTAYNADPAKRKDFYHLVKNGLKTAVKEGIDQELAESIVSSLKFQNVLGTEGNAPQTVMANACLYNNIFDDATVNIQKYYETISEKMSSGYLEGLIETYMVKNRHAALVTTTPKAGLLEKNEAAMTKRLAKLKASMSKSEIKKMVKEAEEFNTWNSEGTTKEVLASMNAVAAKDLPVELKEYTTEDTVTAEGYRRIITDADIEGVGNMGLVFDESHLSKEELHYLKFYTDLINTIVPAGAYQEADIQKILVSRTNGFSLNVSPLKNEKTSKSYPALTVRLNSLEEDYKDNLLLVKDMLLDSDLSQLSAYGQRAVGYVKAAYQQEFNEPINLILLRALAYTDESFRMSDYLTGLDYYNFILKLEKELEANPESVEKKLTAVRDKLFSKSNLTVMFAGNKKSQKLFLEGLPEFTKKLSGVKYQPVSLNLPKPAKREAFTSNTTVQYMVVNSGMPENGIASNGKYDVAASLLTNILLIPEIRLKGGSYGAQAAVTDTNYYNYTYRDNNFVQSLATIQASGMFLEQIAPMITQADLDNYIISTFAAANVSAGGELNGAVNSMYSKLVYQDNNEFTEYLNQIKQTTVEDVAKAAKDINKLNENCNYIVVAPESMIQQNKELFDVIQPLN